ncbi:MAG: WG repeat-containing protein [Oscillospiraceae bacterium]|nr:WG repeat-containing protein [Oscillospiraceae bacterium]
MKKFALLTAAVLLIAQLAGCSSLLDSFRDDTDGTSGTDKATTDTATDSETETDTQPTDTPSDTTDTETVETLGGEYEWLVEPTVKFDKNEWEEGVYVDSLWLCPLHGYTGTIGGKSGYIDETALTIVSGEECAHGWSSSNWVYDPATNKFGDAYSGDSGSGVDVCSVGDVIATFPHLKDCMLAVHEADLTMIATEDWGEHLPQEAYSGKVAVMYNGKFVTGFVFADEGDGRQGLYKGENYTYTPFDIISLVDQNDNHGIVDKDGNVIVPFEFERILVIDEHTAFAKQDGLYGIIKF